MTINRIATRLKALLLLAGMGLVAACAAPQRHFSDTVRLTIIGMNDVHGELQPRQSRGGLAGMSGFIDAVRAARRVDNGAVLVIDAGDMWQGTLESNLLEGSAVVDAYNAIGVNAAAIGNHEFDFGPAGRKAIPDSPEDDPRGALKQRATEARFPLLAANLIDVDTGRPIEWENVQPSTLVEIRGVKVGIIGVMSSNALQATISANTYGLRIAPLADAIEKEARSLRGEGANIVIVTAHAGSRCTEFSNPADLSSCDTGGEIFEVARTLPAGLVDHIIGGHVHQGIAHVVNGIAITASYSSTRAFSRVDIDVNRDSGTVEARKVYPPQQACLLVRTSDGACAAHNDDAANVTRAAYEGQVVVPNAAIQAIADRASRHAEAIKNEKLGVYLEAAFDHPPSAESPLANLMTDAILDSVDADIAMHNVVGGIRNTLPQGELTFGAVYEMFPFDNRVVLLELTGAELRTLLAAHAHNPRRRVGFSGLRVHVSCAQNEMNIVMELSSGHHIRDVERVTVAVNDYLALGGDNILTPVIPTEGFDIDETMPLTRDVLVDWFRNQRVELHPDDFLTNHSPKWNIPTPLPPSCGLASHHSIARTGGE